MISSSAVVCAGTRHHGLTLQQWWQFAAGLLGGRLMLLMASALPPLACAYAAYLAIHPVAVLSGHGSAIAAAVAISSYAFIGGVAAFMTCRRFVRQHAIARLTPKVGASVRSLQVLALAYSIVMLPIAVALRTYMQAPHVYLPGAMMSFADVRMQDVAGQVAVLLFAAVMLAAYLAQQTVRPWLGYLIAYYGVAPWGTTTFAVGVTLILAVAVVMDRLWFTPVQHRRFGRGPKVERLLTKSDIERLIAREVGWPERLYQWRIARAARSARKSGAARLVALLGTRDQPLQYGLAIVLTLLFFIQTGGASFMGRFALLYLPMVAMTLAMPLPQPLTRMWLIPGGCARPTLGRLVLRVWLADAWRRLAAGVACWLVLNTLFWVVGWRPLNFAALLPRPPTSLEVLVWLPLTHTAALAGFTLATCLLMAAWPRLLAKPGAMRGAVFVSALAAGALAIVLMRVLSGPGEASFFRPQDGDDLRTYLLVNALLLPLCAGTVFVALQPAWRRANIAQMSASMQKFSQRLEMLHKQGW